MENRIAELVDVEEKGVVFGKPRHNDELDAYAPSPRWPNLKNNEDRCSLSKVVSKGPVAPPGPPPVVSTSYSPCCQQPVHSEVRDKSSYGPQTAVALFHPSVTFCGGHWIPTTQQNNNGIADDVVNNGLTKNMHTLDGACTPRSWEREVEGADSLIVARGRDIDEPDQRKVESLVPDQNSKNETLCCLESLSDKVHPNVGHRAENLRNLVGKRGDGTKHAVGKMGRPWARYETQYELRNDKKRRSLTVMGKRDSELVWLNEKGNLEDEHRIKIPGSNASPVGRDRRGEETAVLEIRDLELIVAEEKGTVVGKPTHSVEFDANVSLRQVDLENNDTCCPLNKNVSK
jgi:hypothetical protein